MGDPGRLGRFRARRKAVQFGFLAATNLYLVGWLRGSIYTGLSKMFPIPGLHCYSCPSSVLACPVGSMQSLVSAPGFLAGLSSWRPDALALVGLLGLVLLPAFVAGRIACAYVCPFGLLQELVYRLPVPRIRVPASWRAGKYLMLVLFVFALPMLVRPVPLAGGDPWFCKVVCPAGTSLAGWPLALHDGGSTLNLGWLFGWKTAVAALTLAWFAFSRRPFCRVLCPLGALWGAAGKVSLLRMRVSDSCLDCGKCRDACPVDIQINREPNSAECIRCGECARICPVDAISQRPAWKDGEDAES